MTEDNPKGRARSVLGRANSLFHRSKREESVDLFRGESYLVGDIREERPVQIEPGATIAGNVVAPRVVVAGLVYGSVTAREVTIEFSGQIWGDVYTAALDMHPGGKMNGWVTTLNEGTVDLLRAGEISLVDLPGMTPADLAAEDVETLLAARSFDPEISGHWLPIWRQLQSEAAVALIARAEIEAAFEERLQEALEAQLASAGAAKVGKPISERPVEPDAEDRALEPTDTEAPRAQAEPASEVPDSDGELWRQATAARGNAVLVEVQRRLAAKEAEIADLRRHLADTRAQLASTREQLDEYRERVPPGIAAAQIDNASLPQADSTFAGMMRAEDARPSTRSWAGHEDSAIELALCLKHMRARSERVSELTAALVERELELSQARSVAEKRLQQLEQVKALASKRIRQLDEEIHRLRTGE